MLIYFPSWWNMQTIFFNWISLERKMNKCFSLSDLNKPDELLTFILIILLKTNIHIDCYIFLKLCLCSPLNINHYKRPRLYHPLRNEHAFINPWEKIYEVGTDKASIKLLEQLLVDVASCLQRQKRKGEKINNEIITLLYK